MIAAGSKVSIHYTLTVDGAVVDSSSGKEPLEYVQGEGMLVPGIEKGLAGAAAGEKRRVVVAPAEGYGEAHPELIIKAPREALAHLRTWPSARSSRAKAPTAPSARSCARSPTRTSPSTSTIRSRARRSSSTS